jgi:hypothetical protein
MKISLKKIMYKAIGRPPGYVEEVLSAGRAEGGWLHITPKAYQELKKKYSPSKLPLRGLGDAVAVIAKPIARAIDRIAGTDLEQYKPCARRQAKLNAAIPFKAR